ncbi:MAG: SMC-Scp complex subunit ScpB [bacterium]|nr:SMC-Scp complex subunit ScpB [bacterium]
MTMAWTEEDDRFDEAENSDALESAQSAEFDDDEDDSQEPGDIEPRRRRLLSQTEALLLASTEPLTEAAYVNAVGKRAKGKLPQVVEELNAEYVQHGRAFEVMQVAGGYMLFTRPEHGDLLRRFLADKARTRLSRAALESLAVIAFRGPVTRVDIDEIRGVDSGGVLRNLLDRRLIRVKGRADLVGRPLLYEITDEFLKYFGVTGVSDLPRHAELTRELGELQIAEQVGLALESSVDAPIETQVEEGQTEDVSEAAPHRPGNGHHTMSPRILSDDESENQS